jgi:hypothetical protein
LIEVKGETPALRKASNLKRKSTTFKSSNEYENSLFILLSSFACCGFSNRLKSLPK